MRSGVLFVNPTAGRSDDGSPDALAAQFPSLELRECEPDDLARQLKDAAAAGTEVVAVAGGDGTIRTAASVLSGSSSTLLVVPLGTFNHFARSLGIDSVESAATALTDGEELRVDVGDVNGETFVNNASIGWYAEMLQTRAQLERRIPRQLAKVAGLVVNLPRAPRFDVEVAGRVYRTWLVWVGNGSYGLSLGELNERGSLSDRELDVRILVAERRFARLRAAAALFKGDVEESDSMFRFLADDVTFRVARAAVAVGIDGDGVDLSPPLRFRSVPAALSVLALPGGDGDEDKNASS